MNSISTVPPGESTGPGAVRPDPPAVLGGSEPGIIPSPDLAAVSWYGTLYTFTARQRSVVACLFQARREGYHVLTQAFLLQRADSDGRTLRDLFKGNPAWGKMIVQARRYGGPVGCYRLAPAPGEQIGTGEVQNEPVKAKGSHPAERQKPQPKPTRKHHSAR